MFVRMSSVRRMSHCHKSLSTLLKTILHQSSVRSLVVVQLSFPLVSDSRLFAGSLRRITRRMWRPWTRRRLTWRRPSPPAPTSTPSLWRPSRRRRCYWWSISLISTSRLRKQVRQPRGNVPFLDQIIRLYMKRKSWQRMIFMRMMRQLI